MRMRSDKPDFAHLPAASFEFRHQLDLDAQWPGAEQGEMICEALDNSVRKACRSSAVAGHHAHPDRIRRETHLKLGDLLQRFDCSGEDERLYGNFAPVVCREADNILSTAAD